MNFLLLIFMSSCQFILLLFKWSPQYLVLKLVQLTFTGLSYGSCHNFSCLQSRAIHPEDGGSMSLQIQCKEAEDIHLMSHILRVVQLQTRAMHGPCVDMYDSQPINQNVSSITGTSGRLWCTWQALKSYSHVQKLKNMNPPLPFTVWCKEFPVLFYYGVCEHI